MSNMNTAELLTVHREGRLSPGRGLAVENGKVCYWEDSSIQIDLFDINLIDLMKAMEIDTIDQLFDEIKDKYHARSLKQLLDENHIDYGAYSF